MTTRLALALVLYVSFLAAAICSRASATLDLLGFHPAHHHTRTLGYGQVRFDGAGPERWALRFRREQQLVATLRMRVARQRYLVLHRPDVREAINLAAATYGNSSTLWRKAGCESGLNRYARNLSGATGLFQFLPSTWRSTPYGGFSMFSPYAQALAAGWMHVHGRGGEWVCR